MDVLPYWGAYVTLTNSRRFGMSVGPVPLSEIAAYTDLFPGLDTETLARYVCALDGVYLEYMASQSKSKAKTNAAVSATRKQPHGRSRARA